MPLKQKIQVIVLLCIALLSTAALTGLHFVTTVYDSVLYKTAASALSSSALKVQNNLNNLNSMADLFLSDNNIQNYLGIMKDTQNPQEANLAYRHVYYSLSEYCTNFRKDHIRYMNLYQGTVSIHTHVPAGSAVLPATIEQDLCERARKADGATPRIMDCLCSKRSAELNTCGWIPSVFFWSVSISMVWSPRAHHPAFSNNRHNIFYMITACSCTIPRRLRRRL